DQLTIDHDLTLAGPGTSILTVSGNNTFRVFEITSAVSVTISGLTIANGLATQGGGIFTAASTLTISDSVLSGHRAVGGNGAPGAPGMPPNGPGGAGNSGGTGLGGGILVAGGAVTIISSTLSANQAIGGMGGVGGDAASFGSGAGGPGGSGGASQGGG